MRFIKELEVLSYSSSLMNYTANAPDIFGAVAIECPNIELKNLIQIYEPNTNIEYLTGDYYRPIDSPIKFIEIEKYPDDKHLYRKKSDSSSKGEKLYHIEDLSFFLNLCPWIE